MKKNKILLCVCMLIYSGMFAQTKTDSTILLSSKERSIVLISAYTAQGNMPKLQVALNDGLNEGLTISEIKEMLVQLYAYAGFPRSLNALNNLMAVLEERKKKSINDAAGREPSPYPARKTMLQAGTENQTKLIGIKIGGGVYEFAPAIDQFLKEHLFGAIFGRDNLDWKTREIITIAALAAMEGAEPQLRSHFGVGMYNGITKNQLAELVTIIEKEVSPKRGMVSGQVLQAVINQKPYTPVTMPDEAVFPIGQKIDNNNFSGTAWLKQLILSDSSNQTAVGNVTFEPGARTNWHLHPGGQILLATGGLGYYQEKGSPKRLLRKGDVVKCPPNVPHWHGASHDQPFIQIAITNNQNGVTVWMQPVTDNEYNSN
ncbi:MAG: carboxymuconolactone decarboxylase family protein [Chitinophagaceae bacterium]|nr:carboxymuconolactone decarboxylase family protein [Chitinophagaceae bacterium]HQV61023.1 carboxymuconolactone decarboxylase family protein [Chitinophagaceae bacterium]HQV86366.1 carboxymuconolactone decarboxylase family protein [Chitinophagaceae bacterium]HQX74305.1 carboxymuconolactone decarboxylase family protein [Chitinophagaceae bacterium]HQZ73611.1 carboxymuconolactone decarboxylase family protein [Chitinophagaceae bacterium]